MGTCGACRNPFPGPELHRVGHRLLCPICLTALDQIEEGEPGPGTLEVARRMAGLHRLADGLATGGLVFKALVFALLLWWAATSPIGAAALQGALGADILTWLLFSITRWHARGLRVTPGAVFEVVLIIVYLKRGDLFAITHDPVSGGLTLLFFIFFAVVKCAVWGAQQAIGSTGVVESV